MKQYFKLRTVAGSSYLESKLRVGIDREMAFKNNFKAFKSFIFTQAKTQL